MRYDLLTLVFLAGGLAVAAEPAGPASRPSEAGKVLILPMARISGDQTGQQADWIAKAVQQSLVAEVARTTAAQPVAPAAASGVTDPEAAVRSGREAGARYVVLGSYQVLESDLRITAQVLEVETGNSIGALKATGSVRELFSMEDTLGSQLARLLPRREGDATAIASATSSTAPAVAPEGAVRVGTPFDGSGLERSLYPAAPMAGTYDNAYDRYVYNPPVYPYYPSYGYSYGGYPYGYGYGVDYFPYGSGFCGFGSRFLTVVINRDHDGHHGAQNPMPTPTPPAMTPNTPPVVVTPHPSAPGGLVGPRPMQPMRPVGPAPGPPVRPQSVGVMTPVRGGK